MSATHHIPTLAADIARVASDPAASHWLKGAVMACMTRDPVDAATDADTLAELMNRRAENLLCEIGAGPARRPSCTPGCDCPACCETWYAARVAHYEAQGLCTSDAQGATEADEAAGRWDAPQGVQGASLSDGDALQLFIIELKRLGFGTDEEVNGADLVDLVAEHFERLCTMVPA